MSIADSIPALVAARTARTAARNAERQARDTFIQAQFPLLAARFDALLAGALGTHTALSVTSTAAVEIVHGRTFAALNKRVVTVRSTITGAAQTVTFTPALEFRELDQFGVITCALDFPFAPRPARSDDVARSLLTRGVVMRGKSVAGLFLTLNGPLTELTTRHLEEAFTSWWLR